MQSTVYVQMAPGVTIEDMYQQLKTTYEVYLSSSYRNMAFYGHYLNVHSQLVIVHVFLES